MDGISEKFYEYISQEIAGSEKIVKYRREFSKIHDAIRNKCDCQQVGTELVSSGSLAKGMQLPGSDYDVMLITHLYPVYERSMINSTAYTNNFALLLETDLAQPGFALLRVHGNIMYPFTIIETEYGSFLSNRSIKERMKFFFDQRGTPVKINGPCITDALDTKDVAFTLRCDTWPEIVRHWLTRPRSDWPSSEVVTHIGEQGVLLVPIGSKSDSSQDNPLEWRLSFSAAEKVLIHSFSHTQFLCYAMLKILTKDVIKKVNHVDKLICSYFLKTTILWLSEENTVDMWTPKTLLGCFKLCLKRLLHWYSRGYIPNYFIPQHNMIDRKIQGQSRDKLISELKRLNNIGWKCLLECPTFGEFFVWNVTQISHGFEPEKAMFTLFPFIIKMFHVGPFDSFNQEIPKLKAYFAASYIGAQNDYFSFKTRSICFTFLAHVSHKLASASLCDRMMRSKNKQQYQQHKEWLSYALLGTNSDSLIGWLLVAVFFYLNKNYYKSLMVLDHGTLSCCMRKLNFSGNNQPSYGEVNKMTNKLVKSTLFCNIRSSALQQIKLENPFVVDYIGPVINGSPVSVLRYLIFLCHHKLGDIIRCKQDIENLQWTVTNDTYFDNLLAKGTAFVCLSDAFRRIDDYKNATFWQSVASDLLIEFEKVREEHRDLAENGLVRRRILTLLWALLTFIYIVALNQSTGTSTQNEQYVIF